MCLSIFKKKINIDIKNVNSNLIYLYKNRTNTFKINSILEVPQDCAVVFVSGERQCDELRCGEYKFNAATVPILWRKGSFVKVSKKKIPRYFKADLYFIALNNFVCEDNINKKVIRDKRYGKFIVKFDFMVNYKINDPSKIIKVMLIDWAMIRKGKAIPKLVKWIEEDLNNIIDKNENMFVDFNGDSHSISTFILERLKKDFEGIGLIINDFLITDISFSENIATIFSSNSQVTTTEYSALDNLDNIITSKDEDKKVENSVPQILQDLSPTTNNDLSNGENLNNNVEQDSSKNDLLQNENKNNNIDDSIIECPYCHTKINKNVRYCPNCGNSIIEKQTFITCPNCGTNNPIDAEKCCKCFYKFKI
jgi:membrane protease subunit (stomatin/prohibitin family)